MIQPKQITGLILSGGAGRRVDGQDKGLLLWRGQPLIGHVCNIVRPKVHSLFISCNRNHSEYAKYCDVTIADERDGFMGPLSGLEACIESINTPYLVIAPCDMPNLPDNYVERLVAPLDENTYPEKPISLAYDGERSQFLCLAMKTECLESVGDFLESGGRKVQNWIESHGANLITFPQGQECFANLNTLTDLASESEKDA